MSVKKEKGITLVALAITIIVLTILASVTLYVGTNIIKRANLQNINTDMMLIQAKTKTIKEQASFNKDNTLYKGTVVSEISGNTNIDNLIDQGIIDDPSKYYLLTRVDLNEMGLSKINVGKGYAVNYETEEIIFVQGFEHDGNTYYKLSDLKNLKIE